MLPDFPYMQDIEESPESQDGQEPPASEEGIRTIVRTMGGNAVADLLVPLKSTGLDVKRMVREAGGPVEDLQLLCFEGRLFSSKDTAENFGLRTPKGCDVCELTMLIDPQAAFKWRDPTGGKELLGHVFTRCYTGNATHGACGYSALPPEASWTVTFGPCGSHGTVGVATGHYPTRVDGYCHISNTGEDGNESWILGVSATYGAVLLRNGKQTPLFVPVPSVVPGQEYKVRLRRRGTELLFLTPSPKSGAGETRQSESGAEEELVEHLLFSDLPKDHGAPLFAVAAAVWGGGTVTIGRLDC